MINSFGRSSAVKKKKKNVIFQKLKEDNKSQFANQFSVTGREKVE